MGVSEERKRGLRASSLRAAKRRLLAVSVVFGAVVVVLWLFAPGVLSFLIRPGELGLSDALKPGESALILWGAGTGLAAIVLLMFPGE